MGALRVSGVAARGRGPDPAARVPERRAFTLIELLIVVAIIAVLALIALPNLLEAQTRAKAARAKADLRSLATAIEAYYTEWRDYPIARTFCAGAMESIGDYNMCPQELTTPVAFITQRPLDVFNPRHQYKYIAPGLGYANYIRTILPIWVPRAFPEDTGPADDIAYYERGRSPVAWALWSVGPFGPKPFFQSDAEHIPVPKRTWYDPTNGTVSEGVIARLSTGHVSP